MPKKESVSIELELSGELLACLKHDAEQLSAELGQPIALEACARRRLIHGLTNRHPWPGPLTAISPQS